MVLRTFWNACRVVAVFKSFSLLRADITGTGMLISETC